MEKHAKPGGLRALGRYPVLILFTAFFAGVFLLDGITPDRRISELENTTLTQRPAVTAQILTARGLNDFFNSYSQYTKDQIPGRDAWIGLQSFVETTLLQKTQSGGVLLGAGGQMFDRTYGLVSSEERTLPRNIAAVAALAGRYPGKVYAMVAPSAAAVYPERVPAGAPLLSEESYVAQIRAAVEQAGGTFIPLQEALETRKDEYIYYHTDHHWTTLGAYYAYDQLCQTLGLVPFDRSAHTAVEVENFYGTFYSRARTWNAKPDVLTYYQLDAPLTIYQVTGPGMPGEGQTTGLYDLAKLDAYDKYAAFLHGNNGLSRVEGEGQGRILVIKDSYANSLVPFLTANYADIDVIDLRNYNYGLDALIQENQYDQILVLYSFDSFKSDPYLYRAGIEG